MDNLRRTTSSSFVSGGGDYDLMMLGDEGRDTVICRGVKGGGKVIPPCKAPPAPVSGNTK